MIFRWSTGTVLFTITSSYFQPALKSWRLFAPSPPTHSSAYILHKPKYPFPGPQQPGQHPTLQHLSAILSPELFPQPQPCPPIHPPNRLSPIMTAPHRNPSSWFLPALFCLCPALSGLPRNPSPREMPPYHFCRLMCRLLENEVRLFGVGHLRFLEVFGVVVFLRSGQGLSRCFWTHGPVEWSKETRRNPWVGMPSMLGIPGRDAGGLRPGYFCQGVQCLSWGLSTHLVTPSSPGVATPKELRMSHALIFSLWKGFSVLGILQGLAPWLFPWVGMTKFQSRPFFTCLPRVYSLRTDFPTWGSGKGTENPQGIWLWRPVEFDFRTSTGLGK